jgi:V-type H+-transporting ATPase subunit E
VTLFHVVFIYINRKKLEVEFKAKREQHQVEKLITASKKKQAALSSVMDIRNDMVVELKKTIASRLAGIEKHADYPKLMVNLIVQALVRLQEERVTVRVRKIDEELVKKILKDAEATFKKAVSDATGFTPTLQPLTIDSKYLPGPLTEGHEEEEYCSGGVMVIARGGRITCRNTLDARLDIAFNQLTPQIRSMCFGERAAPANAGAKPAGQH